MATAAEGTQLSFYIHIPYCVKRCGYCDFNTYTPAELKIESSLNVISRSYIDLAIKEVEMARHFYTAKSDPSVPTVPTVTSIFFGGGTPSLMDPVDLGRIIDRIRLLFGLADGCEITLEANPDSLTRERLLEYRKVGVNRLSMGMQSAVPHVLTALDRTHNPNNVGRAVNWAKEIGFQETSLDLIYGTPGESMDDWRKTVESAIALETTHISAYALIVEEGTKLAAQVKRGEQIMPDEDETADKYLLADQLFSAAGLHWYELSNWSKPGSHSRHNMAYWLGKNWWGVGPGAHSHIDGRRWWNVKHPNSYRERIEAGESPMLGEEILTSSQIAEEKIMLLSRIPGGILRSDLSDAQERVIARYIESEDVDGRAWIEGGLTLTPKGRLIADRIVRELLL